ncbi:MAG: RsmD family RNA methyltransferase [Chloroflexota bacterium]|nr:RsmD family RNA methyltransferase [Chloroflexota bacterium]
MADAGRVIAGAARGIRLLAPGEGTRPLSDRVKQALFGVLEAEGRLDEADAFLDLFAGSGAAGIEALSRGCGRAVFVERNGGACRVIAANLTRSGLAGGSIVRADVFAFLGRPAAANGAPFGSCLLDPPYGSALLEPALECLADPTRGWLGDGAVVAAKHFWRDVPPARSGVLERYRERRFGETMLSFYRFGATTG